MQLQQGTKLFGGRYVIERHLGQGGFGITYLATQLSLNRKVAIKEFFIKNLCEREADTSHVTVPTQSNREMVARFRKKFVEEAQTIAALNHSHIVRIYDIFEENGTAYYVMEYHGGGSLADVVAQRGSLSEADAVRYTREIADALDYLHKNRRNHLDVKPANILLDKNGGSVLIDFGISKHYDENGEETASGIVGISQGYAPLEQCEGDGIRSFSPATDIYALGATLYKLLTGNTPPKASEVLNYGLPSLPDGISPLVRNAVKQAMRPKSDERPQSISTFLMLLGEQPAIPVDNETDILATDVEVVQEPQSNPTSLPNRTPEPTPAPAPAPKKRGCLLWIMLLLLIAAGVAIWLLLQEKEPVKNTDIDSPRTTQTITPRDTFNAVTTNSDVPSNVNTVDTEYIAPKPTPGDTIYIEQPTNPTLHIITNPSGATVTVDGNNIGKTPISDQEISPGRHKISISKSGYKTLAQTKTAVQGGSPVVINETLTPLFTITSNPTGATVTIDGKNIGKTPIANLEITPGSHTIRISKSGYETIELQHSFGSTPETINEALKKIEQKQPATTGKINGHEYVDLGLSVKWATCNVGASSPAGYGDYFAWGETTPKSSYDYDNCKTYEKNIGDISGNYTYDAARANWRGSWRLPTKAEMQELIDNCTWTWTTQNGVNGYKVKSKKNGNSIFLPAAGWRFGTSLYNAGESGNYWTSTPYESITRGAYYLGFGSGGRDVYWYYRNYGLSVRPVSE